MTPTDPTPIDEPLLDALVAADEGEGASAIPTEFQDCFRLLEEVWPAHRAGVQDQPWRLARFEVLREVGRGGFGIVYQAHDPVVGRDVALKVPVPEVLVSAVPRQRFLREARAAGCLDHPNIVPVHEAGESGPLCYIISTFCDGPTLAQWLGARKEPVPVRLAAELLEALASAVQHAHDRGILHRDLKPSNVLMVDGEVPRITDFGLARLAEQDGSADLTQTGVPMGSPPYMSPEQAAGRNAEVGPASDIYGLGAILYELVAGRPPFQGQTTAETLRQVIEGDPVAPRLVRPGLPRDLETIILTCLAKEPARRYGTAALLAEDLRRFLAGEPITARPPSLGVRLRNSIARHRLLAVSGTLTSVAVAGMLGIAAWSQAGRRDAAARFEAVRQAAAQKTNQVERDNRHLARTASVFRFQQVVSMLKSHQVRQAREALRAIQLDFRGFDPDEFAWRYVRNWADRVIVPVSTAERWNLTLPSPDGETLAAFEIVGNDVIGPIHLLDRATLRPRHSIPVPADISLEQIGDFSRDGRLISCTERTTAPNQSHRVWIWEVATGRMRVELKVEPGRRAGLVVMLAGERFLIHTYPTSTQVYHRTSRLWEVTPEGLDPHLVATLISDKRGNCCASRDGRTLVVYEVVGSKSRVHLVDVLTGSVREMPGGPYEGRITQVTFSRDGKTLAGQVNDRELIFWDIASGEIQARWDLGREVPWRHFLASEDGRTAAVVNGGTGKVMLWDRDKGRNHVISPPGLEGQGDPHVDFSQDGARLAVWFPRSPSADALTLWDVATDTRLATAPGDAKNVWHIVFTPDGRELIINCSATSLIWRLDPPDPTKLAGHKDEAWAVAFSRNADLLATGSDDTDEPQTIKLWDPRSGHLVRGWFGGRGTVSSLALSPDGKTLASAHLDDAGSIRLWEVATGNLLAPLEGHTKKARSVAFHPSGRWLASGASDGTARIWDVAKRECACILTGHKKTVQEVAFSPDGKTLATAGDKTLRLWEVPTGQPGREFEGGNFMSTAFSPDGAIVAAADEEGRVWLWDVESGTSHGTLPCGREPLNAVAFTPGGEALAVAGMSGRIQLWDVKTHQELLTLQSEGPQVNGLAFSPDGSALASASHDGAVRLWRGADPVDQGQDH